MMGKKRWEVVRWEKGENEKTGGRQQIVKEEGGELGKVLVR